MEQKRRGGKRKRGQCGPRHGGQRFTQVSYRDALQRASRKVTESESKYRDDVITPESQGQNGTGRFRRRRRHQGQGRRQ